MAPQQNMMTCPLCEYKTDAEYAILLHMEESHAEGKSPFVADPDPHPDPDTSRGKGNQPAEQATSGDEDAGLFVECPIEGCLEQISLAELEDHIDLHAMEENDESASDGAVAAADVAPVAGDKREYQSPYSSPEDAARSNRGYERERARSPANHESAVDAWKRIFGRRPVRKMVEWESKSANGKTLKKRLGVSELGKHAYEHQMPDSLVALLRKRKYTSAEGIIQVLARLLEQNSSTEYAYLCHPAVQHISKLRGEGGFCGYRNIQMLSSYIVGARVEGAEVLGGKIPSIFRIQDYIENAWDMGINTSGRVETGGVRGTRKYIGTPEAQAMFISLKIPCEAEGFKSPKDGVAEAALFAAVQKYFESGAFDPRDKVRCTELPPIYFQHRGHSLTIVGLEKRASGSLKLLVFDPMFHDPDGVIRLAGRAGHYGGAAKDDRHRIRHLMHRNPDGALRLYRRGNNYLKKYHEFELLRLKTDPA
ncbi:peptidase family C78-domain-containing protein [Xylaria digitata]|nr:peptidase family C78-domain-containing protein [Xylaria digitata]